MAISPPPPLLVHLLRPAAGCTSMAVLLARMTHDSVEVDGEVYWTISTRRTPRQIEAGPGGASIYWIMESAIQARAAIVGMRAMEDGQGPWCQVLLHPALIPVVPRFHRAFQGWRYLAPADVPPDLEPDRAAAQAALPASVSRALRKLSLI